MTARFRHQIFASALATALLALAPAAGAQVQPSLHLQPARAAGTVANDIGVGPFTIANYTQADYAMRVFPVLLGQSRDGGLFVRDDGASLALARARMAAQVRGFAFPPGAARSVFGRVRRVPPGQGFYGGILFRATPKRTRGSAQQITSILQLDARVILDPRRPRVSWVGGAIRAEQDRARRIRILVPVTNRGNTFARISGHVRLRDAAGRLIVARPLRGFQVLPGATVDLPTYVGNPVRLPKGHYTFDAVLRGAGRPAAARGTMDLFGVNEVRTERARLLEFPTPRAYIGDDTSIKATFRNTGNVAYAPPAQLEVRPLLAGQPGPVVARAKLEGDKVAPGKTGEVSGSVKLPQGTRAFELRVRLLKDGHEVDSRTNSVTPVKRPPILARIRAYVTEHAMLIVALILGAMVVGGVFVGRYIRRLKAAARR
jgi:hypothetical protein